MKDINDLPMDAICGNCGRKRGAHYPRRDWECPSVGSYFNQPTPLVRRIAEATEYAGLSNIMWMSDLDGLVEHVRALREKRTLRVSVSGSADLVQVELDRETKLTYLKRKRLAEELARVIGDSDAMAGSLPSDECDDQRAQNERLRETVSLLLDLELPEG